TRRLKGRHGRRLRQSLTKGDLLQVFVDLEHHDQQFAPESRSDQTAYENSEAGPEPPSEYAEHNGDPADDHTDQAYPVKQGDDLRRQHRVEEEDVFHGKYPFDTRRAADQTLRGDSACPWQMMRQTACRSLIGGGCSQDQGAGWHD